MFLKTLFLMFFIVILLVVQTFTFTGALKWKAEINDKPIIGILSQEIGNKINKAYPGMYDSYIAASYVKFVESAGARVIPIWIGQDYSYYQNIMSKINGVLLPGGSTFFNQRNGYADAGEKIYEIAKNFNDNDDYFPIWGTCLGFELLTYLAANRREHRDDCSSQKQPLSLEFTPDFKKSRMFKHAPYDVIDILQHEKVTANFHRYCVTLKGLENVNLIDEFRILSYNHDWNNLEFISSLEHVKYPFYGIQFHPEKNPFEWAPRKNISHTYNAIKANRYFADFFVNEARKNRHNFVNKKEESEVLIYNYPVTYTGLKNSSYVQCYLFKKKN